MVRSASRSSFLFEHDLFGKPDSTFPDHALELRVLPFVHHAVHAALPTVILAEMAPMVSPHPAAIVMPVAPAMPLRAFQVAHAPIMMRAQQPTRAFETAPSARRPGWYRAACRPRRCA